MNIITWNANHRDRWRLLFNSNAFKSFAWDAICLQEVGDPQPEWVLVNGRQWTYRAGPDETTVIRQYSYAAPHVGTIYITHAEWVGHQKNHLVMITRTLPTQPLILSGDQGYRPWLGITVRLTWGTEEMQALLGCVHIKSRGKGAKEVEMRDTLQWIKSMAELQQAAGWVIFGDFNTSPDKMEQEIHPHRVSAAKGMWSQKNQLNYPIDYAVYSAPDVLKSHATIWDTDAVHSDHRLMLFHQPPGGSRVWIV
jgi:endonuclease/exonuclease/phosphatase family metal-dependent hydrolase